MGVWSMIECLIDRLGLIQPETMTLLSSALRLKPVQVDEGGLDNDNDMEELLQASEVSFIKD